MSPRLFRGWRMVGVVFVGQMFGVGPLLVYTFGVFVKPLAAAFGSNRGSISGAVSVLDVVIALAAPVVGWLVDRYGGRRVIAAATAALSACLIALAGAVPPLWHLYVLYAMAGLVGVGTASVTYGRVLANWFDRRRGLALGLGSAGVGLGAFLSVPFAQWLVDRFGWRGAYLGLAAVTLLIALPLVAGLLRGTPEEVGLRPDGDSPAAGPVRPGEPIAGMSASEAARTGTFWQLFVVFFLVAACINGAISHLVPLLTDRGVPAREAALATSLFGLSQIVGRVGNGYLVDRFFAPRVTAVLFAGAACGIAILLVSPGAATAPLVAACLGLAGGAESDVIPFLVSRYFGMRSMARLYGCAFGAFTLGNATGRYLFGVGFDRTGSYQFPLTCALAVLTVAVIGTLALGRYAGAPGSPPVTVLPHASPS